MKKEHLWLGLFISLTIAFLNNFAKFLMEFLIPDLIEPHNDIVLRISFIGMISFLMMVLLFNLFYNEHAKKEIGGELPKSSHILLLIITILVAIIPLIHLIVC